MTDQSLHDLRTEADDRRDAIARDVELVADRITPGRIADRQKAKVRARFDGVRDLVFGVADRKRLDADDGHTSLRDRAGETIEQVKDATPDSVGEFTEGNPLAAGLIGLGVGLLAATLLPTSRDEQRIADRAQGTLDAAAGELAHAGQQAVESTKPALDDAVQAVKSSARDSAESVKQDAKDAAHDMQGAAADTAHELRSNP